MCYRPNDSDICMWVGKYVERKTNGRMGWWAGGRADYWMAVYLKQKEQSCTNLYSTIYLVLFIRIFVTCSADTTFILTWATVTLLLYLYYNHMSEFSHRISKTVHFWTYSTLILTRSGSPPITSSFLPKCYIIYIYLYFINLPTLFSRNIPLYIRFEYIRRCL
jgi:hypothetical protein